MTATASTSSPTEAAAPECVIEAERPTSGQEAIDLAGASLRDVANAVGMSRKKLASELREDEDLKLDTCGRPFFSETDLKLDPAEMDALDAASGPVTADTVLDASGDAFQLHSRPASSRVIYLDFNGQTLTGTVWNDETGLPELTAAAFSFDDDASFSSTELDTIKDVWARIAEHYAPFDVDVTTEEPTADELTRTSLADQEYGGRALFTPSPEFPALCANECAGQAYLGVFNTPNSHAFYQTAWISTADYLNNRKYMATVGSHEVGHMVGLSHDGKGADDYYGGHGVWAPIMGGGSSVFKPVQQWSQGEYTGATNQEDDLSVMTGHGLNPVSDDHGDDAVAATPLVEGAPANGNISTAADEDWFSFVATDQVQVSVDVQNPGAALDARLVVKDSDANTVASVDPAVSAASWYFADGLSASTALDLAAGETYYAQVSGVGFGTVDTGYSDYASLGRYIISASEYTPALPPPATPPPPPAAPVTAPAPTTPATPPAPAPTTPATPPAPTNVKAKGKKGKLIVKLSPNVDGVTGYIVKIKGKTRKTVKSGSGIGKVKVKALKPGKYKILVRAYNSAGRSGAYKTRVTVR